MRTFARLRIAGQDQHATAVAAQAWGTVRSLTNPISRARFLVSAAKGATANGRHQDAAAFTTQAEAAARSITHPYLRGDALGEAAHALAMAGETHAASRVAAAACAVGKWTAAVTAALVVDPSALTILKRILQNCDDISAPHIPSGDLAP